MNFERVPIPVGSENVDPGLLMMLGGVAVAAALVLLSAPRMGALLAVTAGAIAGALALG